MYVEDGERFVPRLFAELDVPIRSVSVAPAHASTTCS